MPGASFCGECGTAVLAAGSEPNPAGEFARTDDPSGYTPSTLASDGTAIPGEIAGMGARTGAWLVTNVVVKIIGAIPFIGWIVSLGLFIWNLLLFRRGQDVGARIVGLRVVRNTGELAGFYHMWTRGLASIISFIVLGAGYWRAYLDNDNQTWHDKWLGTYVVKAGPEVDTLPGTSSSAAKTWFWISLIFGAMLIMLFIAIVVFLLTSDLITDISKMDT
jgi:uncharacterized RDD family membrane protein YckC